MRRFPAIAETPHTYVALAIPHGKIQPLDMGIEWRYHGQRTKHMMDGCVWKLGIPYTWRKMMFWIMEWQGVPHFHTKPYHSVTWSRTIVSLKAVHRYAWILHRFAENKHGFWNETVSNSKIKVRLRVAFFPCLPCYIRFDVFWQIRQVYRCTISYSSFDWLKRYFGFKSRNM